MSGTWIDQLQPASWRGIPFAVRGSEYRRGRRQAVHEYPFRDLPWVEDVGRSSRLVGFSGFVVGDDCFQQAHALLAAAEQPGPGQLVHPSLGTMTVSLVEPMAASERTDLGRVVEIRFEFMETGTPLYPGDDVSTQDDVNDKADAAQAASQADFDRKMGLIQADNSGPTLGPFTGTSDLPAETYTDSKGSASLIPAGPARYDAGSAGSTLTMFGASATKQASDPSLTANAAAGVSPPPGTTFGRFDGIGSLSFGSDTTQSASDAQVANRAAVSDAATKAVAATK